MPEAVARTSTSIKESTNAMSDRTQSLSRRKGRQSQESLLLLLDVDEVYPALKHECLDHAALGRVMASVRSNVVIDEWIQLYWQLDECQRDYQQMVIGLRLEPVLLFSIYQRMLRIEEEWLDLRTRELTPEQEREMS